MRFAASSTIRSWTAAQPPSIEAIGGPTHPLPGPAHREGLAGQWWLFQYLLAPGSRTAQIWGPKPPALFPSGIVRGTQAAHTRRLYCALVCVRASRQMRVGCLIDWWMRSRLAVVISQLLAPLQCLPGMLLAAGANWILDREAHKL